MRTAVATVSSRKDHRAAGLLPTGDEDGLPLIGKVPQSEGLYVATGHNVWGILNAPATGEALAQLIAKDAARVDLSPFDPARLRPLDPSLLQAR
ncbi:NAD(P)/FAD-dependent oxidoreductase [Bradyrhizobium japonicum]